MFKCHFIILCGTFFFTNDTYSQNQKIVDSLNAVLVDKIGGERYLPLHRLAIEYVDADNERALEIIKDAEQAALLAGDSLWIVKSKRAKCQILLRLDRVNESINLSKIALSIAQRNQFTGESTMIVNNLATSYVYNGLYDKALKSYFQSYELSKQGQDSTYMAIGLQNIGLTYYKLKDYAKGLNFLKESLEINKVLGEVSSMHFTNISLCYAHLKDYVNAQYYAQQSLTKCGPKCSDAFRMHLQYAMGVISHGLQHYDGAERYFLESYSLSKKVHSSRFQFDNIYFLAEIYIQQQQFKKCEYFLDEAERLINKGSPFNLEHIKIYTQLYAMHSQLGNFKKVAYYQAKYIQLKDSIYNEALTTNLMKIESDYQEKENVGKIAEQNVVLSLKEDLIIKQERLNLFSGMLALMLLILVVILWKSIRQKKLMNKILDQKVSQRTQELNENIHALKLDSQQRNLRVERSITEIKSFLATIKGLSFIALSEIHDINARFYITEMDATSQQIAISLEVASHVKNHISLAYNTPSNHSELR